MAHTKFPCEVLTPEGEVFNDEVEMVSTRTTLGLIGILANHAPLLARLEPTELRIHLGGSEVLRFAQAEGFMQMSENHALLLVEQLTEIDELDRGELERASEIAQSAKEAAPEGSEEAARAARELRRAEAFLRILDAA
ncbi:MAG TPA: ATP synthase F1 subunit epsilon [Solirubrobacteraceae bacterium]|jgi:F-type H+-transporting ATPase subunit epsilon|nr:ATP synthase F1 subunit epsilon [Solirubrobacteraceae bacterium]